MATLQSLNSTFKIAKQASKGTGATTGFTCGRFLRSSLITGFDYIDPGPEHFCGSNTRPTVQRSIGRKNGYLVPWSVSGFAYPSVLPLFFIGLGFGVSSSGTNQKTHACTIADADAAGWLTVMQSLGTGANKFERIAKDARLAQLALQAGPRGIQVSASGIALAEQIAAGTETKTDEVDAMILPSKGSATINVGGVAFTAPVRGMSITFQNQLNTNEMQLFSTARADLPSQGLTAAIQLIGLDVDLDTYEKLWWGADSATAPDPDAVTGDILVTFKSTEIIQGSTPDTEYSLAVDFNKVEFRPGQFTANGRDFVRGNVTAMMVDDANPPATVTVINSVASY